MISFCLKKQWYSLEERKGVCVFEGGGAVDDCERWPGGRMRSLTGFPPPCNLLTNAKFAVRKSGAPRPPFYATGGLSLFQR